MMCSITHVHEFFSNINLNVALFKTDKKLLNAQKRQILQLYIKIKYLLFI
jgi:hypothetical protein